MIWYDIINIQYKSRGNVLLMTRDHHHHCHRHNHQRHAIISTIIIMIIIDNHRYYHKHCHHHIHYHHHNVCNCSCMGLLPDTKYCGLRMRQECRERFPRHQLQRIPLVSNPGMHHGTCVTHVPWCMSGSLTRCGRGKRSRHSRRMRNPQLCVSGKRPIVMCHQTSTPRLVGSFRRVRFLVTMNAWASRKIYTMWSNLHITENCNICRFYQTNAHDICIFIKFGPKLLASLS